MLVVCLLLLVDDPLARINFKRLCLSREITWNELMILSTLVESVDDAFNFSRVKLQTSIGSIHVKKQLLTN